MKIRFTENTNIRRVPTAQQNAPVGIVYAGTELEVEDVEHTGTAIGTNRTWYRDQNGWYYWSGKTEPVYAPPPPVAPPPPAPAPPASVSEDDTHRPAAPAFPTALPLPDDDDGGDLSDVPEGETRRLGPPPTLAPPPVFTTENPPVRPPVPVPPPDLWRAPDTRLLNWGISNFALAQWWQERGLTGRGVRIALLSTGAALDHPDLAGAVSSTFDVSGNAALAAGSDQHGLGTQAAVVAAGRGRLAFGVAPEAALLVGKVGEYDHDISPENLLAGLHWAIDAGAHIAALLVDFRELTEAQRQGFEEAIARASEANILLLAPVGNSTEKRPETRYPAGLEGVMCIGAHDQYGQRSAFSAKSPQLDVLAPGEALLTSDHRQQSVASLKTTAIATAFAAGVMALVRQWEQQNNLVAPPNDFCEHLRSTAAANKAITQGNDVGYGYGLLNPAALLQSLA
jgi:subtilisin family serine protease